MSRNDATLTSLDDRTVVERLDPHGLLSRIESLPEQCEEAWRRASELTLPPGYEDCSEIVVLGMGGSAIAGDLVRALAAREGRKPVYVSRGYEAPTFVSERTLVVACSHSGNTEETLAAFDGALAAGARGMVVTTGGQIEQIARERDAAVFTYEYDGEPRSALGHQLMTLLALAERAGVFEDRKAVVPEAIGVMRTERERIGFASPVAQNPAKQLAGRLHGRLPVVVGASVLGEAAHRWKTQLNENSEVWAIWEELPELDHNTVVGFGLPGEVAKLVHVVLLSHSALRPQMRLRYEATEEALTKAGVSFERLEVAGTSLLAQMLNAIYLGDLVSYYLALLNGVEPSPVHALDRLKERLAEG